MQELVGIVHYSRRYVQDAAGSASVVVDVSQPLPSVETHLERICGVVRYPTRPTEVVASVSW